MASAREDLIALLDAFQAAERAGAAAVEKWVAVCADARLRGGLRVISTRDRRHADLAAARLREMGGSPAAQVSRDPGVSDRSKLAMLLARSPAGEDGPLAGVVRRIHDDPETRALLETIDDDERASVGWLRRMRDLLDAEGA
jgi:hypothetical protein